MATTPNLNLPIFTLADTARLDTLLNSLTSALDTNVQAKLTAASNFRLGIDNDRTALSGADLKDGLLFWTTDTKILWQYTTSWAVFIRPLASYAATVTGLNLAQVTVDTKYEQRGKFIRGEILITRTVAGSPTGNVSVTLPTTPANASMIRGLGMGTVYLQNNTTAYQAASRYAGGGTVVPNISTVSGSAVAHGNNVSAAFPTASAHGVGTTIYLPFEYETS